MESHTSLKPEKTIIDKLFGYAGKIFGSKGQYSWDNKNHVVLFNCNICTQSHGKIWYGDFDITVDEEKLVEAAKALKERVYVLYESDARFENEKNPKLEHAVFSVDETGKDFWNEEHFIRSENGRIYHKEPDPPTAEEEEEKRLTYLASEFCKKEKYQETNVKIPWAKIKRLSAKKSPLHKFWGEVADLFDVPSDAETDEDKEKTQELFSKIMISAEDHKKLKESLTAWIEKYYEFLSDYRKEKEISWGIFMSGPDYMLHTPEWMKSGVFYLKVRD